MKKKILLLIVKLSNNIYDLEMKYTSLENAYDKMYGKDKDIFEKDLNKFLERNKIRK